MCMRACTHVCACTLVPAICKQKMIFKLMHDKTLGHDANFSMNFEPVFLIIGLELVSTRSYSYT